MHSVPVLDRKMDEIRRETSKDPDLQVLIETIVNGFPNTKSKCSSVVLEYWNIRDELSVVGVILRNNRVVIPRSLRKEMLVKIHSWHLDIAKCRLQARQVMYWPGMNQCVEEMVQSCSTCAKHRSKQASEPLNPHLVVEYPWEKVGVDICHEIHVFSDNGTNFMSSEFQEFARNYDFKHTTSSPNFPQSNGLAEESVGIVKSLLKKSREDGSDFYMNYRTTPLKHGKSPFELLHGRKARSNLPIVDSQLLVKSQSSEQFRKEKFADKVRQKFYYDKNVHELSPWIAGTLRIRDSRESTWSTKAVFREEVSPRSYLVETDAGNTYRRNRKDILKCVERETVTIPDTDGNYVIHPEIEFDDGDIGTPVKCDEPTIVTKSSRTVRRPNRLIEGM
ncbi:uncharacterized protein K02A2.6-like [Ylistrum balloti]|uniref:uncharacterized protein K02A2.6-like n=1 Tax=Ylistrum balloti TaxID=509963 RepID=UPI0029058301|nr:uncharacterized protein K02A2.6-like [Ylistrum balloti]